MLSHTSQPKPVFRDQLPFHYDRHHHQSQQAPHYQLQQLRQKQQRLTSKKLLFQAQPQTQQPQAKQLTLQKSLKARTARLSKALGRDQHQVVNQQQPVPLTLAKQDGQKNIVQAYQRPQSSYTPPTSLIPLSANSHAIGAGSHGAVLGARPLAGGSLSININIAATKAGNRNRHSYHGEPPGSPLVWNLGSIAAKWSFRVRFTLSFASATFKWLE
ncbi:unnamed protein product [Parascedosporium putredinis]|uniref:Uncharacterized protein n=1 Tax=Parascedosporium putredinis TaxID=1442378 RepID=A0A9P1MAM2_9PEZI|nr:unnamed protein product [Parascedosporium putredinis]CAI7997914.1 unnamed protein product [Parascedosporium putredinis]